jgi:hypothetical protein
MDGNILQTRDIIHLHHVHKGRFVCLIRLDQLKDGNMLPIEDKLDPISISSRIPSGLKYLHPPHLSSSLVIT